MLLMPPSFLMGFPMPPAMTAGGRLCKDHMFLWAWGINGCFSVIGAALVPIVGTSVGLAGVVLGGGIAQLLALPDALDAAVVPHGLPDAARHDRRGTAVQGPHVPVGVGHQWLLLGDRRGAGADR